MVFPSASATPWSGWPGWLGALALVMAGIGFDAAVRSRHILAVSTGYGVTVDAPVADAQSPTGYAHGVRSIILSAGASDTCHWIMQTQEMIARGEWRIRRVDYDHAPSGREVHWAAPFHWWLAGLAWMDHAVSGRPVGQSVERAVLYSGPVMLGLLLGGLGVFLHRRISVAAAWWLLLGAVAYFPFYLDFEAGYADHHGLANLCALLTVLFLVVGGIGPGGREARRWFVFSAVAGATGLWISAATEAPVLLALGASVVIAGGLVRKATLRPVWLAEPGLWRIWGWTGGAVGFAAYLLEYFPAHLGWRLEVNHPLYALAWIGAGEVLRAAMVMWRDGVRSPAPRELAAAAGGAALVLVLPVTIFFTAAKTFVVADPFVWQLHTLHISEFQPLVQILRKGLGWTAAALCLPMLLVVPPLWLVMRRAVPGEVRAQFALALLPAVVGWIMGWNQVRWLSLGFALSVPVIALYFRHAAGAAEKSRLGFRLWLAGTILVFLPGLVLAVQAAGNAGETTQEDMRCLAQRDVAHWLRLRGGDQPVVVAASPSPTTRLVFYGGITGVDTLYWENAAGLKDAAELFGAPSAETARAIATRLGLTHLVFFSWASLEATLARLQRGLPDDTALPRDTFAAGLLGSPVPPPWLRGIPFKLPDHPALAGSSVRIWEITQPQPPAVALAGAANYFLELGMVEEAGRLAPLLARFGDDLSANIMLAAIASRQQDAAGFSAAASRMVARLDRAAALSPGERVHLVVVLAVAGEADLARNQLRGCLQQLDEPGLRGLTPGTLADLLALSEALAVPLPSPELQQRAESLLPPGRRK